VTRWKIAGGGGKGARGCGDKVRGMEGTMWMFLLKAQGWEKRHWEVVIFLPSESVVQEVNMRTGMP